MQNWRMKKGATTIILRINSIIIENVFWKMLFQSRF